MGAQENKRTTEEAYAAFSSGDAEGAMRDIDDSIEWVTGGENALSGTRHGKQAVGELWGRLQGVNFSTKPHDFLAEGDKVVVLTTVTLDGDANESADVLLYNAAGQLIRFEALGDPAIANRVFPR